MCGRSTCKITVNYCFGQNNIGKDCLLVDNIGCFWSRKPNQTLAETNVTSICPDCLHNNRYANSISGAVEVDARKRGVNIWPQLLLRYWTNIHFVSSRSVLLPWHRGWRASLNPAISLFFSPALQSPQTPLRTQVRRCCDISSGEEDNFGGHFALDVSL